MSVRIEHGDSREVLKTLADNSVDSCVCDPPYALVSIVKRFGNTSVSDQNKTGERARNRSDGHARHAAGFMGMTWDSAEVAFDPEFWKEVYRVLKPGAHLLAMGGTRTYHRLACAIEDAGFEIRDSIMWLYGSGFPKSHDVSKAIDQKLGAEREKVRESNPRNPKATGGGRDGTEGATRPWIEKVMEVGYHEKDGPDPVTDEAKQWEGWGTALKPAAEIICLARKPLSESSIAANVLKWGTGALNVDACRIETGDNLQAGAQKLWSHYRDGKEPYIPNGKNQVYGENMGGGVWNQSNEGRWPANVCHDGSEEVTQAFPSPHGAGDAREHYTTQAPGVVTNFGGGGGSKINNGGRFGDEGSAARFFYTAKADATDRWSSKHPTVKPVDLMRWLVCLVTPPNGTVLDPFSGSGTTGAAAIIEERNAILIERDDQYVQDILDRIEWLEQDDHYKIYQNAEDKTHARSEIASVKKAPPKGWWR